MAAPALAVYRPRAPEHTVLWQCVRDHLPAFLAQAAEAGRAVPDFVREELEGFLRCGILEEGFARVKCGECGFERLVPLSCKGRGVCPSCIARRMSDTAAHLVDRVLPHVPIRQWVLSLPVPLRYLLAWDTELGTEVIRIFVGCVVRRLQRVAKAELGLRRCGDAHVGAVCVVQRWGGSANLNPHIHGLVTDGVFVRDGDGSLRFRALPAPSRGEIAAVAWDICERVVGLLRKRGQWLDAASEDDALAEKEPLLAQLYAASLAGTLVMGPKAGQRQLRLFGAAAREHKDGDGGPKNGYGFDVDASVRVPAHDRSRLEALARYMLRPPLSRSRLEKQADGRYRIRLKKPWSDGSTHLVLDGPELLGRLAALVPPPNAHVTRYFGVFAPRSMLRPEVIPKQTDAAEDAKPTPDAAGADSCEHVTADEGNEAGRQRRLSWSQLLARVFSIDVLRCARCGSRMQRVEWCLRPERIQAVLRSRGPPVNESTTAA